MLILPNCFGCFEYRLNAEERILDYASLTVFTLNKSLSLKFGLLDWRVASFSCFFLPTIDELLKDFLKSHSLTLLPIGFYRLTSLELLALSIILTPICMLLSSLKRS